MHELVVSDGCAERVERSIRQAKGASADPLLAYDRESGQLTDGRRRYPESFSSIAGEFIESD